MLSLKRGEKLLKSNKPYQAIKFIGQSLTRLYKNENKEDLYFALCLLSECYEKVDLLWASRANLLLAASFVTDECWKSGDINFAQVYIYSLLSIIEIKLGRINYALSWWKLVCILDANLEVKILTEKRHLIIEAYLSQCILNAGLEDLTYFSKLPDLLDKYQLFNSRAMLLYALGYKDIVEEEYELKIDQKYINSLEILRDTDLGALTPKLVNCDVRYSTIKKSIMGALISVSFPFRSPLVELAETVLSGLAKSF